jgi:hypothetical protein
MAFFQLGSESLPAWIALKNSRNVSETTKTNGAGTWNYQEKENFSFYFLLIKRLKSNDRKSTN